MSATIRQALAGHFLLSQLGEDALDRLADVAHLRRLSRGQVLFVAGEPSDALHVVARGRLRVLVTSARGDELVLGLVGPGEAVGDLAMLDGGPRSADVDAVEDTELAVLPAEPVREILLQHPAVLLGLAQELAGDVRRLTGRASDLVFLDLRRRLAKLLLDQAAASGDDSTADLGLSQSGVAARVGTTRQSLNRAMGELARRGWIRVDGQRVHLLDRTALGRFADS